MPLQCVVCNLLGFITLACLAGSARADETADKNNAAKVEAKNDETFAKLIRNTIGMKLGYIPPGTFTMGSPPSEQEQFKKDNTDDFAAQETQHEVSITKPKFAPTHLLQRLCAVQYRHLVVTQQDIRNATTVEELAAIRKMANGKALHRTDRRGQLGQRSYVVHDGYSL